MEMTKQAVLQFLQTNIVSRLQVRVAHCRFRLRVKPGMTKQEAADAFEAGLQQYLKCILGRK
jgi:hypothetical protein